MDIERGILSLYEKDTAAAYQNFQALEALSKQESTLYPYLEEFIAMLGSDRYVVRVRGLRLLCKQARWDDEGKIDGAIDRILDAVKDEKPTAVRQALKALEDVVPAKPRLCGRIRQAAVTLDYSHFKDTMQPLIYKDIQSLVGLIDRQEQEG